MARNTLGDHVQSSTCLPLEPTRMPREASVQQMTMRRATTPARGDGRSQVGSQVGAPSGSVIPRSAPIEEVLVICRTKAPILGFLPSAGLLWTLSLRACFSCTRTPVVGCCCCCCCCRKGESKLVECLRPGITASRLLAGGGRGGCKGDGLQPSRGVDSCPN